MLCIVNKVDARPLPHRASAIQISNDHPGYSARIRLGILTGTGNWRRNMTRAQTIISRPWIQKKESVYTEKLLQLFQFAFCREYGIQTCIISQADNGTQANVLAATCRSLFMNRPGVRHQLVPWARWVIKAPHFWLDVSSQAKSN